MFSITIMLEVLLIPFVGLGIMYAVFPRKTKNLLMAIWPAWKKRYVVCHLRYQAGMVDVFAIIPNMQGLTKVGHYSYDLQEKYKALRFNKRDHYILDENNVIPVIPGQVQTNDNIVFQAAEIQTALDNSVMDYLFSKKKEWLIYGLFALAILCAIIIGYNIVVLNSLKGMIQAAQNIQVVNQ